MPKVENMEISVEVSKINYSLNKVIDANQGLLSIVLGCKMYSKIVAQINISFVIQLANVLFEDYRANLQ